LYCNLFNIYKLKRCKAKKEGSGDNVLAPLPIIAKSVELISRDEISKSSMYPLVKKYRQVNIKYNIKILVSQFSGKSILIKSPQKTAIINCMKEKYLLMLGNFT
jgi:putative IMPACT (imprinted ancient) family translation regulator